MCGETLSENACAQVLPPTTPTSKNGRAFRSFAKRIISGETAANSGGTDADLIGNLLLLSRMRFSLKALNSNEGNDPGLSLNTFGLTNPTNAKL